MRRIIITALVISFGIAVISGGSAVYHTLTERASASGPNINPWADINGDGVVNGLDLNMLAQSFNASVPGARPVVEQNLDANGNIKVHEQGTVNVNVTPPITLGRIIPITQNHVGPLATLFVATSDCARLDVFASAAGGAANVTLYPSLDGVTGATQSPLSVWQTNGWTTQWSVPPGDWASNTNLGDGSVAPFQTPRGAPFVGVQVGTSNTVSVSLYCHFAA